jgi:hypothetical protein
MCCYQNGAGAGIFLIIFDVISWVTSKIKTVFCRAICGESNAKNCKSLFVTPAEKNVNIF